MYLDLHEIIEVPGGRVPFSCQLDSERVSFPALLRFEGPVTAEGVVENPAGVLTLRGDVRAEMTVACDRCGRELRLSRCTPVTAVLAEDAEDGGADLFPLSGDGVDVTDVLETCFILETDMRYLCQPDCKGLCPQCGKDLNEGPCDCKKPTDPRMAVLGQLLDTEE